MGERCDRQRDAARERVAELARGALARGEPTSWFESLYREAGGDAARVPWADLVPNAAFATWAASPGSLAGVRTAAVVGCGLGHDAELLSARGVETWALDLSPTAIAWARRLHPRSSVRYEVADLLALPAARRGRHDLVVEVYTLQALPLRLRPAAAEAIRSLVAPSGRLFVFTRVRDDGPGAPPLDEATAGPPWPLGRAEAGRLFAGLRVETPFSDVRDPDDPAIVRAHAVFGR